MHAVSCPGNDSAETHEPAAGRHAGSLSDTMHAVNGLRDGVADLGELARDRAPEAARANVADAQSCRVDASAKSWPQADRDAAPEDHEQSRTFLEQLLDEMDAMRDAEAAPRDDSEGALSETESGSHGSALRQQADAGRRAFSRADALVGLAQGYLRGDRPNRAPIEVTLTMPASSLRKGTADPIEVGQIGESFVSCEAARRLSCDSGVVEVIEDEHGAPLSVGRKRRTITGPLKRALHTRDKTCTFPGCTNRLFLEGHHIKHWADGGETALNNATLMCSYHHQFVHEHGYSVELDEDQRSRFRDPHGRPVTVAPDRPALLDLGWPRIRAQNEPLAIDANTIACEWDGRHVPYGAIIGHLVAADGLQ